MMENNGVNLSYGWVNMKLEEQVVSLDMAKEMKELGFKQDSLWWYVRSNFSTDSNPSHNLLYYRDQLAVILCKEQPDRVYPAYTVAELGSMLPEAYSTVYKMGEWFVCEGYSDEIDSPLITADTEADARGKMLIYLKKEGLI